MRNLGGCRGPWGVSMWEGAESFCQEYSRAGRYEQKLISLYFLADLRYTVYISVFSMLLYLD